MDGTYSPKLLLSWVRNFPYDSPTVAHLRGGQQFRGWDVETYLLANILDAVQVDSWLFMKANSKKSPKKPEPFERPSTKKKSAKDPANNMFAMMARSAYNKSRKGR